ncbi:DNA damage-regulated autophagy modulator protein 1-like [Bacillus rossius redtenbacheri]|uniref:DNA damage-regulated autophagy modulator protein 1-like n=1 Tax=Bacillus rossius redtenbacheri TaxID=93214 RepID=UPI002FDCCC38
MYTNLHFLPIAVCVTLLCNVIITYAWAVSLGHVAAGFPYISDAGSLPPESCFFSLLLHVTALLTASCVYLQYRALGELLADNKCGVSQRLNASAAWLGVAASLGLGVLASFQQSSVPLVHLVGAGVCFAGGTVYFCWQTWFSYSLRQWRPVSPCLLRLRLCLSLVCLLLMALACATALVSLTQFDGRSELDWRPRDGGWDLHVASSACEWLLAAAFCGYFLSLVGDFRRIRVEPPAVSALPPRLPRSLPGDQQAPR